MKVLITTTTFAKFDTTPLDLLKERSFQVVLNPFKQTLSKEQAIELYSQDFDAVIAGTEVIDCDVLEAAKKMKVISRCGTGTENIDSLFAEKKKIKIFNTPDAPVYAVAEFTLGLVLALLRGIPNADRLVRNGLWEKKMGLLLRNKTVGIVGFGRIGKQTAVLLKSIGAKIIFCDPIVKNVESSGFVKRDLHGLLADADIVILHLPYCKENHHLFKEKEFSLMKRKAFLVNVSRGGIIDEKALYRALKENIIAGAALDVFETEPYNGDLKELDNIIITPHIGSYARESRIEMEITAVKNLLVGLEGFIK